MVPSTLLFSCRCQTPAEKRDYYAKNIQKVFLNQISNFLMIINCCPDVFQSGFHQFHRNCFYMDSGRLTTLVLLELSAAFDTVHHNILLNYNIQLVPQEQSLNDLVHTLKV